MLWRIPSLGLPRASCRERFVPASGSDKPRSSPNADKVLDKIEFTSRNMETRLLHEATVVPSCRALPCFAADCPVRVPVSKTLQHANGKHGADTELWGTSNANTAIIWGTAWMRFETWKKKKRKYVNDKKPKRKQLSCLVGTEFLCEAFAKKLLMRISFYIISTNLGFIHRGIFCDGCSDGEEWRQAFKSRDFVKKMQPGTKSQIKNCLSCIRCGVYQAFLTHTVYVAA